jgi:hypothetical protein
MLGACEYSRDSHARSRARSRAPPPAPASPRPIEFDKTRTATVHIDTGGVYQSICAARRGRGGVCLLRRRRPRNALEQPAAPPPPPRAPYASISLYAGCLSSLYAWAWDLVVTRLLCCGLPAPARRQFFALRSSLYAGRRSVLIPRTRRSGSTCAGRCCQRDETCPISTEGWTRRVHFVREGGGGGCSRRAAPSGRATLQRDGVGALTEHALPTPTDVTKPKPQRFTLRISARRAHRWSHLRPQRALGPGGGTRLDPAAVHAGVFPAVPHHAPARAQCPISTG